MSGPSSKALAERIEALAVRTLIANVDTMEEGDQNVSVPLQLRDEITAALRRIEALDAENARLRNVAKQAAEGWDNAIEMGLLPQRHHTTARIMRDEARAALKGSSDEG